jgi:hypothetical protein
MPVCGIFKRAVVTNHSMVACFAMPSAQSGATSVHVPFWTELVRLKIYQARAEK